MARVLGSTASARASPAWTAPARGVLGLLAMSGPGRRAEAEEQMRKLRPLPCSPAEEEAIVERATTAGHGGVSPVGRALQKHAARSESAFAGASGNAAENTERGAAYLQEILESPEQATSVSTHKVFGDVIKVRLPDGSGAWFKANGEFIGFLERYTLKP